MSAAPKSVGVGPGRSPSKGRSITTPSPARVRRLPSRRAGTAPRPVPPPYRARRRPLAFFVFAALVVGGLVLGLTALNAVLAQGSFRIDDLSRRVDRLQQDYDRRQLDVARLSAPGRIAREASSLGMGLPPPSHVKVMHLDGKPRAPKKRSSPERRG